MGRNSTPTSLGVEDRGGLTRKQFGALDSGTKQAFRTAKAVRRTHDDTLLASLFGEQAVHFKDHPLDGPDIISAAPAPGPERRVTPVPINVLSADDPVRDQANWFKGSGREGQKTSTPDKLANKASSGPMSIGAAAEQASSMLAAEGAFGGPKDPPIMTGLPGDDYTKILDSITRPPNTY